MLKYNQSHKDILCFHTVKDLKRKGKRKGVMDERMNHGSVTNRVSPW